MAKAQADKITIEQLAKMFGLPDWDRIDEMNQSYYDQYAADVESDPYEGGVAADAVRDEVFATWYDAVEHAAEKLLGEHGLELAPTGKKSGKRPFELKIIPTLNWNDAANKIRETINGVGNFHFNNLREFLDSGPYTARQAVLEHLGYIKRHPEVYGNNSAHSMYERAWR
jgi:hypothetical protein